MSKRSCLIMSEYSVRPSIALIVSYQQLARHKNRFSSFTYPLCLQIPFLGRRWGYVKLCGNSSWLSGIGEGPPGGGKGKVSPSRVRLLLLAGRGRKCGLRSRLSMHPECVTSGRSLVAECLHFIFLSLTLNKSTVRPEMSSLSPIILF